MHRILVFVIVLVLSAFCFPNYPHGTVKAYDRTLKRDLPISGVEIQIESNGYRFSTHTDSVGSFGFPLLPNKKVSYRLKWQYKNNLFDIRTNAIGQAFCEGPRSSDTWNPVFREGEQQFFATIFRAGATYLSQDFVTPKNQFEQISIKAYPNLRPFGHGSARHNAVSENIQIWGKSKTGKKLNDVRLFSYVVHELGHAHHDHFYLGWSQHLQTSLRLKESWAEAIRYFLTRDQYGENIEEVRVYSKQYPFFSGWKNFKWERRKKYFYNYTPFMIDLVDTLDQEHLDDRVSGYTLVQIQKVMERKECRDFDSMARLLRSYYSNPTEQ